jgi:predicted nucleic acid-binding Zn finger protein
MKQSLAIIARLSIVILLLSEPRGRLIVYAGQSFRWVSIVHREYCPCRDQAAIVDPPGLLECATIIQNAEGRGLSKGPPDRCARDTQ